MKSLNKISLLILVAIFATQVIQAQTADYKHTIIASGKITDHAGRHIGSVTKEGVISDSVGTKVAHVDKSGFLIDAATGKKLGRVGKNGSYVAYSSNKGWSVTSPANGTCLVKDEDGNVKAVVHENYKNVGACAIHCLTHHMKHDEVLDENKMESATYTCSMHPDVTSDKPGKCSKCGMELMKKEK